jgi:D-alanyl-D-alanine carboxypeptidase
VGNFVNLNETGVLSRSGQGYDSNAQDQHGASQQFRGQMEASHQGLKGSAGGTFTGVSDLSAANLAQLANQIADQAVRAVRAEHHLVGADEQADSVQQVNVGNMETHASAVARPINV